MRVVGGDGADSAFDTPPRFSLMERRRAALAEAAWIGEDCGWVPGFDEFSIFVDDPGGLAWLTRVGVAVTDTFGLVADLPLERRDALTTELSAACDLLALNPKPLHFEATLVAPRAACILLRGVALPLTGGQQVQIVLSWREVLNRTATARLKRDFVAALQLNRRALPNADPFSSDFSQKPRT